MALRTLVHELLPVADRVPKKKINFQLASDQDSFSISGFSHNAITPFGLLKDIPIVVCKRCLEGMHAPVLFLGGGKVDLKLSLPVQDLIKATGAIVGEVTELR